MSFHVESLYSQMCLSVKPSILFYIKITKFWAYISFLLVVLYGVPWDNFQYQTWNTKKPILKKFLIFSRQKKPLHFRTKSPSPKLKKFFILFQKKNVFIFQDGTFRTQAWKIRKIHPEKVYFIFPKKMFSPRFGMAADQAIK